MHFLSWKRTNFPSDSHCIRWNRIWDDGTLWGSEVLLVENADYQRLFHFDYMPLVGGEKAIEEPWRLAASLLQIDQAERFFGERGRNIALLGAKGRFPLACGMAAFLTLFPPFWGFVPWQHTKVSQPKSCK